MTLNFNNFKDICANAPRDYTRPYLKKKTAAIANNRMSVFPNEGFKIKKYFFGFILT